MEQLAFLRGWAVTVVLISLAFTANAVAEAPYVLDNGKLVFEIPSEWSVKTRNEKMLRLIREDCTFFVMYRPTEQGFQKELSRLQGVLGADGKKLTHNEFTDVGQYQSKAETIWLTEKGKTVVTLVSYKLESGGILLPFIFYKRCSESINDQMKMMAKAVQYKFPPKPKPLPPPPPPPQPVTNPEPAPPPVAAPQEPEEELDF